MRYEYEKLFQLLKNSIEDINHYSINERSLNIDSQQDLKELELHIRRVLKGIEKREG